jgi:hypothetical protein
VSDLEKYPQWTNLLHRVEPEMSGESPVRAWRVELRGKIGPFARSKRLRMEQAPSTTTGHARFERRELDGLEHGVWILDVSVGPGGASGTSHLSVVFEYRGGLWSGVIELLLRDEIESSKKRLSALVAQGGQPSDQAL